MFYSFSTMLKGLKKFNLPELEEQVLQFWRENEILKKSLHGRKDGKQFVFYEGPPTANARPGMHHVVGRVFKDIILRFKTMQGYYVARRAGWDTHGLPVEIEVEKELDLKSKSDIEKFGIAAFNARAKTSVWKYKEEWEKLTERIGFWLDMEHPYITYENRYIEKLWGIFKKIDERKLLYKGHKVVPWCPRCGTALSSHELAQGYREVTDASVYLKFKIQSEKLKNTSMLVWTTTPWTLLGNVALAINPAHSFVRVPDPILPGHFLIVEKMSAERLGLIAGLRTIDGSCEDQLVTAKDLIGLSYEPLFQVQLLQSKKSYKIYSADFVTVSEGTGVVHTAVMYGEDDYELGMNIGLPQYHTVDEAGNFTNDVAGFAGMRVKNKTTEEKIIDYLKTNHYLFKIESYTHDYPFCWRCNTPVLYYATNSWFIKMSALRAELAEANAGVRWVPEHIKDGRFGEWLREAKDWAISRARYWGTPLPIWECDSNAKRKAQSAKQCDYIVVESVDELEKLGGKAPEDLHRPFIDTISFPCPQCMKGTMARVKEVMDVWFDSGAMPFASDEYPNRYPADYICEAIDQTRGWFYTLLALGVLMDAGTPYKNVLCYSHLLDTNGKKMSKSKGNAVDPWDLIKKYGIDAVRWYVYTSAIVQEPQKFNEIDVVKSGRGFISLLYNSYIFLETYDGEQSANCKAQSTGKHILDRWIMARLHETIREATDSLDAYHIHDAARAIEALVDDLSRWHIRRSRKRVEALPVLRHMLLEISKLIAPFMPFFAEALYQSLGLRKIDGLAKTTLLESVHLEDWPKLDSKLIDITLINSMAEVRRLASTALAERAEKKINVRKPLPKIKLRLNLPRQMIAEKTQINKELLQILADEINVKEIIFDAGLSQEVELDTEITPILRDEGLYREFMRMVQGLRHKAQYAPQEAARLFIDADIPFQKLVEERKKQLMHDVGAKEIIFGAVHNVDAECQEDFDGVSVRAGINRG